jgi:hypothetical protein
MEEEIPRRAIIHLRNLRGFFRKSGQNFMNQMKNFFRMKIS